MLDCAERQPLTCQVFVSVCLVPFALKLQQFVAQDALLLFGFVRVQLAVKFWVRLMVGVGWIRNEGVRWVGRRLGSATSWGHNRGSLVAVDAEAALAGHFDELWGWTGRGSQGHMAGTKGHTPNSSVDAGTLVLAASSEILAVLINSAVVLTGATICLCCNDEKGNSWSKSEAHQTKSICREQMFFGFPFPSVLKITVKALLSELGL